MSTFKDLTNQRFGKLRVVYPFKKRSKNKKVIWLCRCDCGNLTTVISNDLCTERTMSCGCLQKEQTAQRATTHGDTINRKQTRLYGCWVDMKTRCSNPNRHNYKSYGGRGITVCKEWSNNYQAFKDWALIHGYTDILTIDRINNDGDYEPNNCQWITNSKNSRKGKSRVI